MGAGVLRVPPLGARAGLLFAEAAGGERPAFGEFARDGQVFRVTGRR